MQILNLYKYTRSDGGLTVSTEAPEEGIEFETAYRLIAEEGKILTNGTTKTYCVDVNYTDGWVEIIDTSTYALERKKKMQEVIRADDGVNLRDYYNVDENLREVLEKAYAYDIITGEVEK